MDDYHKLQILLFPFNPTQALYKKENFQIFHLNFTVLPSFESVSKKETLKNLEYDDFKNYTSIGNITFQMVFLVCYKKYNPGLY